MEERNFNKDFIIGKEGEQLFLKEVAQFIGEMEEITDMANQKNKGDFKAKNAELYYEIKTRTPQNSHWPDITQEILHKKDGDPIQPTIDGWLYKYGQETIIVYQRTRLIDGKLRILFPVFLYKPFDLRKHKSWIKRFKLVAVKNEGYTTYFIRIPTEKLGERVNLYSITEDGRRILWKN